MAASVGSTLKVLIVDDSNDDGELLRLALERHGFALQNQHVKTLERVSAALSEESWDLVLTDHAMPGLSSHDVIRLAKGLPCIVVSGAVGEETAVELLQEGAVDYVNKNNLNRLGPAAERALDEARNRRARAEAEQALRRAHQELERRVEERTAELIQANQRLQKEMEDRRRAELELLEARLKLFRFREEERARLSRDIHDGVVQDLLGLSYALADTERRAAADPGLSVLTEPIKTHRKGVLSSVRELRSLIRDLRPPGLAEFGLKSALEEFLSGIAPQLTSTLITLDVPKRAEELPTQIAECFFKVAQEAVRNALRHACASRVDVQVGMNDVRALLKVEDNGQGFSVPERLSTLARQNHFGLISVDEYVHLAGGQLHITSTLREGTVIEATVPLSA